MSGALVDYKSRMIINDQEIEVWTTVLDAFRSVSYVMKSQNAIEPATVALMLHLMSRDICERLGIEIDDLIKGLIDSSIEWH